MSTSKLISLIIMYLSISFKVHALHFTEAWTTQRRNSYVVSIDSNLVYVSAHQNSINLTSINDEFQDCQIPIDREHYVNMPIKAAVLGNGKVIIWTYEEREIPYWKFYVVNWQSCTFERAINALGKVKTILTYQDTFDVFYTSPQKCVPCRYNDKGESVDLPHVKWNETVTGIADYVITNVEEYNPGKGVTSAPSSTGMAQRSL